MINTKEFKINPYGYEYDVSVDYDKDGSIVAVIIDDDIMELLRITVMDEIEEAFNRSFEDGN